MSPSGGESPRVGLFKKCTGDNLHAHGSGADNTEASSRDGAALGGLAALGADGREVIGADWGLGNSRAAQVEEVENITGAADCLAVEKNRASARIVEGFAATRKRHAGRGNGKRSHERDDDSRVLHFE